MSTLIKHAHFKHIIFQRAHNNISLFSVMLSCKVCFGIYYGSAVLAVTDCVSVS